MRLFKRAWWILAAVALGWGLSPAALAATGTCSAATGQGVNGPVDYPSYCWIDFTNYNAAQATSAGGEAFTITLPGGSTLSFILKVSGGGLNAITIPTWTGAAFGQSAFTGVPGKPSLYQTTNGTTTNVSLSNIVLTAGSGTVPYAIVAADAESTNNGESLSFTTDGNAWTLLASMAYTGSPTFPTLAGVGTATVTETGVAGNVGAYAFATLGSPTTISSVIVGGGLQGIAFAVKFHAVDFAITKSHSGNFNLGGTGSYTLTVTNDGPDSYSTPDTITVTDTLPTGLSYASASGSGWGCGAVGQVVTCSTSANVASGASLPAITLNVNVLYTAAASVTNTATVTSSPNLDYNSSNDTANDITTIVYPDLSTSTKDVVNSTGGDALPGSTLQYTITLTESAGVAAVNASVTDEIPANVNSFTVSSIPTGATNSSTGAGTGTNGDGYLNITGIAVPANGSVTIVFTVVVAGGTPSCTTTINNTATVTNPHGNGATPSAPGIVVGQSSCAASGSKILYLYNTTAPASLSRTPQPASATTVSIASTGTTTADWTLTPVLQKNLVLKASTAVNFTIIVQRTGGNSNRTATFELRTVSGASIGTSGTVTFNNAGGIVSTAANFTLGGADVTVNSGDQLVVRIHNTTGVNNRPFSVYQSSGGVGASTVSFTAKSVINVDSVTAYNATYSATTMQSVYLPNTTVYICAVVSDPFGSYDIDPATGGTAPKITIADSSGTVQVNAASMTLNNSPGGGTKCDGSTYTGVNPNTQGSSFEYTYAIPTGAKTGFWTPSVTAYEGTEGTITHTANGSFDVEQPEPLIMKSVSVNKDPTGDAIKHSIPGATMQYTITVYNVGKGPIDTGTVVITDPIPANTVMNLSATPPITFTDGSPSSGLSITAGTDASIKYTTAAGGTSGFGYVPLCTRPCTDATITGIQITLNGKMNASTAAYGVTAGAPSFTITFIVIVN